MQTLWYLVPFVVMLSLLVFSNIHKYLLVHFEAMGKNKTCSFFLFLLVCAGCISFSYYMANLIDSIDDIYNGMRELYMALDRIARK